MQLDPLDCEISTHDFGDVVTFRMMHKPTDTTVRVEGKRGDTFDQHREYLLATLRVAIYQKIEPGQPDTLVRLTMQGVARIPWAKQGYLFTVASETPSVDGKYRVVHVKDSAGNTWSLSLGDYEYYEQKECERAPEKELHILRQSLARIAQKLNVETDKLPVLEGDLFALTKQDRGWNALAATIIDKIEEKIESSLTN